MSPDQLRQSAARITDAREVVVSIRLIAIDLAAEIGDLRAMSHLRAILHERMVPVLNLELDDQDLLLRWTGAISDIFAITHRWVPELGEEDAQRRMRGVRNILNDNWFRLMPETEEAEA